MLAGGVDVVHKVDLALLHRLILESLRFLERPRCPQNFLRNSLGAVTNSWTILFHLKQNLVVSFVLHCATRDPHPTFCFFIQPYITTVTLDLYHSINATKGQLNTTQCNSHNLSHWYSTFTCRREPTSQDALVAITCPSQRLPQLTFFASAVPSSSLAGKHSP